MTASHTMDRFLSKNHADKNLIQVQPRVLSSLMRLGVTKIYEENYTSFTWTEVGKCASSMLIVHAEGQGADAI